MSGSCSSATSAAVSAGASDAAVSAGAKQKGGIEVSTNTKTTLLLERTARNYPPYFICRYDQSTTPEPGLIKEVPLYTEAKINDGAIMSFELIYVLYHKHNHEYTERKDFPG